MTVMTNTPTPRPKLEVVKDWTIKFRGEYNGKNIEHQFDQKGNHRLVIDGKEGPLAIFEHVCFFMGYGAVTDYYGKDFAPKVFKINPVEKIKNPFRRADLTVADPKNVA